MRETLGIAYRRDQVQRNNNQARKSIFSPLDEVINVAVKPILLKALAVRFNAET